MKIALPYRGKLATSCLLAVCLAVGGLGFADADNTLFGELSTQQASIASAEQAPGGSISREPSRVRASISARQKESKKLFGVRGASPTLHRSVLLLGTLAANRRPLQQLILPGRSPPAFLL